MKRMLTMAALALLVVLAGSWKNTVAAQPRAGGISYQTFYDELDPYGRWVDYPDYGYVWIPDAGPDFRPYSTNGHWVWSDDYEWMWVSDYNWGWAPFHYGRWLQDAYYGWVWVPGYEWSPAWVAWRDGGDYYGWAPLRPGINISINFSLGSYNPPVDYWCFAPRRYITSPRIHDYYIPRRNNITIINQTTIINNYNYNRNVFRTGPGRRDAERYTGRINPVRFRESSSPGRTSFRNNEVSIYRPSVQRDANRSDAPRRFERFDRDRQNNGTAIRRNENNLPERREGNRNFDRRDGIDRPGRNNEVAERPNTPGNNQPGNTNGRNRRFERPDMPSNRPERREIDRNNNNNGNADAQRPQPRTFERRNIERQPEANPNPNRNMERRDVFRNNNNNQPQQRREMRSMDRPQQPAAPRVEPRRQEQPQPRQFERRNDNNQRGGGSPQQGRGFERRGR